MKNRSKLFSLALLLWAIPVQAATITITLPDQEFTYGMDRICKLYPCADDPTARLREVADMAVRLLTAGHRGSLSEVGGKVEVTP